MATSAVNKNPKRKGTDKRAFLKHLHGGLNQSLKSTETDEPAPIKLEVNCVLKQRFTEGKQSQKATWAKQGSSAHDRPSRTQDLCKVWTSNYCLLLFQEGI